MVNYIATELVSRGELFDYLLAEKLSEPLARHLFKQMISAIKETHSSGFVH